MLRLIIVCLAAQLTWGKAVQGKPFGLDGKIVGGENTTIEEYPYQVSLLKQGRHDCGGSLIRPNIVLSAAHCTVEGVQPSDVQIRAGSTLRDNGGTVVQVVTIHNHPKYDPFAPTTDYDVTVLELDRSLPLGAAVQTITLQTRTAPEVPTGTLAAVTGWGLLSQFGELAEVLQVVQVPKVSQADCNRSYGGVITDRMTCYGYAEGGKDSCSSDSGGPLVVGGKQVGVVSWGAGCASPNYPGVYADVANAEIADHIDKAVADIERRIK